MAEFQYGALNYRIILYGREQNVPTEIWICLKQRKRKLQIIFMSMAMTFQTQHKLWQSDDYNDKRSIGKCQSRAAAEAAFCGLATLFGTCFLSLGGARIGDEAVKIDENWPSQNFRVYFS